MQVDKRKYYDSRVIERYVKKGLISEKDHESYLKALPDEEPNSTWVSQDLYETELSADDAMDDGEESH